MKKRIHILEDDHDIAYIIEYLLSDQNYEVQISSSFAELKEQLRDSIPHLFILDVMLPDGNGIDICRDLKNDEFTKHIPVIVMSANVKGKKMSEDASPDAYISKPFDLDEIHATIKELID
ncbi:response regulator transcription factor [Pedobacter sp.]|uniref:response regulator transcription factor n=1 Tax=Pedobacter sp. TaxID=1411316 RepID=UPI00396C6530